MKTIWQPTKRAYVWRLAIDLAHGDMDHARALMKLPHFDVALDGYDALRPEPRIRPMPGGFMLKREEKQAKGMPA